MAETSTIQIQRFIATRGAARLVINYLALWLLLLILTSQLIFGTGSSQVDHEQRRLHHKYQSFSNGTIHQLFLVSVLQKTNLRPELEVENIPVEANLLNRSFAVQSYFGLKSPQSER